MFFPSKWLKYIYSLKEGMKKSKKAPSSGLDLDKACLEMEINDHSRDLSWFQKEVKEEKDSDGKEWAAKTVPPIEEHLKMLGDLSKMN
jgi:predicted outer membrane protein